MKNALKTVGYGKRPILFFGVGIPKKVEMRPSLSIFHPLCSVISLHCFNSFTHLER